MNRNKRNVHPILVFLVFIFFLVTLIYSPALAKNQPTSTVMKNINITGDTVRNVVLPWGLSVTGKVTDSQGNPVKDVVVTAIGKDFLMQNTTSTNNKGEYELSLPKGTYTLTFTPTSNQLRSVYTQIEKVSVNNDKTVNAKLPNGVFLSGTLLDYQNQPASSSVIYAIRQSDNWFFIGAPDPVTGQFIGPLPEGKYDITAIRSSCVNLPYLDFRKHTNISVGTKNILNDTQLDDIKMPQGIILQGTVKDKNNQTIVAILTILNYKDLKAKNSWVGAQTASNSTVAPVYKAALEKKNVYAIQVVPLHGEGSPNSVVNERATFEIINKIKMKKKDRTYNITVDDGKFFSGTIKDKDGKVVKNVAIIITNIKKAKDIFKSKKIMLVTASDKNGKFSYPLPKGKYDAYFYNTISSQSAIEASQYGADLNTEGQRIQDNLIRILSEFRKNLIAQSSGK